MALHYCQNCTTSYAFGLDACPHCRQSTTTTVTIPVQGSEETERAVQESVRQSVRRGRKEPPPETDQTDADA